MFTIHHLLVSLSSSHVSILLMSHCLHPAFSLFFCFFLRPPHFHLFQLPTAADTHLLPIRRAEAPGYQRVLQVDLEVNGLMMTQGGREVTWQVEYPLTRTLTSEVPTLIRLAPQDLGGIVPLAMVRSGWLSCGSVTGRHLCVCVFGVIFLW